MKSTGLYEYSESFAEKYTLAKWIASVEHSSFGFEKMVSICGMLNINWKAEFI